MSQFRAWWRTSLCRVLGHRWTEYANAEPMTPLSPWPVTWVFGVQCVRCDVRSGPTFQPPSRPSSSSRVYRRVTPEDTNESIAAWRVGSAVMEAPVPMDTPEGFTQQPALLSEWATGVAASSSCNVDHGGSPCDWLTGASARTAVYSTSTPTPSYVSRRSIADSSGSR